MAGRTEREQIVKRTVGHYLNLVEHSLREYEPNPKHALQRLVMPLCEDFQDLMNADGTRRDMEKILRGFLEHCKHIPSNPTTA